MEGTGKSYRRCIVPTVCALLALVGIAAYCMNRGRGGDIGQEAAKTAALTHAGVSEAELSRYEIALDESGGAPVYRVEFETENCAYGYAVSAADGSIVKFSREADGGTPARPDQNGPAAAPDGAAPAESGPAASSPAPSASAAPATPSAPAAPSTPAKPTAPAAGGASNSITEARAKEIALSHAGVTADSIAGYQWKLDFDDGISVYELEFTAGGYEYDYEINAASGDVIKYEKEADPTAAPATTAQDAETAAASGSYIGEARAWEIAFSHAGVTADSAAHCGIALDHENHHAAHGQHHGSNCCVYEVDFHCGGYEYEYKIDALTGSILDFEQEAED